MNFLLRTDSGIVRQHKFAHISIAAQTFPSFLKRILNELPFSINYRISWSRLHHNSAPVPATSLIIGQWVCRSFLLLCRPGEFIQPRKSNEVENLFVCTPIMDGNAGKTLKEFSLNMWKAKNRLIYSMLLLPHQAGCLVVVFNNLNQHFMRKMLTLHYHNW